MDLLDRYSRTARLLPALLVILPLVVSVYLTQPALYGVLEGFVSVLVSFGLLILLSQIARTFGKNVEPKLLERWDGWPTTRWLRHEDNNLDPNTKARYHRFFQERVEGWHAPSRADELQNKKAADELYRSATKWLIEQTRDASTFPILFSENVTYGFRRNIYGLRPIGILLATIAILLSAFRVFDQYHVSAEVHVLGVIAAILALVFLLIWSFVATNKWVKQASEDYARQLLAACDQIATHLE